MPFNALSQGIESLEPSFQLPHTIEANFMKYTKHDFSAQILACLLTYCITLNHIVGYMKTVTDLLTLQIPPDWGSNNQFILHCLHAYGPAVKLSLVHSIQHIRCFDVETNKTILSTPGNIA